MYLLKFGILDERKGVWKSENITVITFSYEHMSKSNIQMSNKCLKEVFQKFVM